MGVLIKYFGVGASIYEKMEVEDVEGVDDDKKAKWVKKGTRYVSIYRSDHKTKQLKWAPCRNNYSS